jgi:hypothetical protein
MSRSRKRRNLSRRAMLKRGVASAILWPACLSVEKQCLFGKAT